MSDSAVGDREWSSHHLGSSTRSCFWTARGVSLLWWAGLRDGVCFHRCVVYFVYNQQILVKTGQCLILNGFIFLGSILLWEHALSPGTRWMLAFSLHGGESTRYVDVAHRVLCALFGVFWLVPVYILSFPLSCVWYQEIATLAMKVRRQRAEVGAGKAGKPLRADKEQDFMVQIAQEVYRVVLFAVFMLQTYVAGIIPIPLVGMVVNFVLLSWLNAFYSFDYQWSLRGRRLEERIQFFERNWAYFLGFGSVCTLGTVFCSFFSGAAILAAVYPLFILIACDADPHQAFTKVLEAEQKAGRELPKIHLPIFQTATAMTSWVVERGPHLLALPPWLWQHRLQLGVASAAGISLLATSYALR